MLMIRFGKHFVTLGSGVACWQDEIWLKGAVNEKNANKIVSYLNKTPYETVSMFIDSNGGFTIAMDKIVKAIEEFNKTKTLNTYCVGTCASSAFEIFLCGKERAITQTSELMYHDAVYNFGALNCKDLHFTVRDLKQSIRILNEISDKSRIWVASHTGLSVRALSKMTKDHKEKWFTTDECMKYKIATKVLD